MILLLIEMSLKHFPNKFSAISPFLWPAYPAIGMTIGFGDPEGDLDAPSAILAKLDWF